MKKLKYSICFVVFLTLSISVLLFLSLFTDDADKSIQLIDFDTYAIKNDDGTLTPLTTEEFFALTPDDNTFYVLTSTITEDNYDDYIQFTPTGMDIRVFIEHIEIYHSETMLSEKMIDQATTRIPIRGMKLPLTITMECRHLGGANTIFPPMLFTTSDMTEMIPQLSYAHRSGIPTGAFAVILIILTALFLFTIIESKPNYSLLILVFASALLTIQKICSESGILFIPEWMKIFASDAFMWVLFALFLLYFCINIKRLKLFGWCALSSGIIFAGTYLFSFAVNGYFAATVNEYITAWIEYGDYIRPMYWINTWLQIVCLGVAIVTAVCSVTEHLAHEQSLELKAELAMENYRVIEEQLKHDADLRHEYRHQISAIRMMLEQNKADDAILYLTELDNLSKSTIKFTDNYVINAILQNAVTRAAELDFSIEVYARVDKKPNIPESDLCGLLFNILDNAFEAVAQIDIPDKRKLTLRIKQREDTLGIYCANTYTVTPVFDRNGKLISHKKERNHGLGVPQMERIAKKYSSKIDFSYSDELFIVQTALFLPHT